MNIEDVSWSVWCYLTNGDLTSHVGDLTSQGLFLEEQPPSCPSINIVYTHTNIKHNFFLSTIASLQNHSGT